MDPIRLPAILGQLQAVRATGSNHWPRLLRLGTASDLPKGEKMISEPSPPDHSANQEDCETCCGTGLLAVCVDQQTYEEGRKIRCDECDGLGTVTKRDLRDPCDE